MFIGTNSDYDVINVLSLKEVTTWKAFLVCFDYEINTASCTRHYPSMIGF